MRRFLRLTTSIVRFLFRRPDRNGLEIGIRCKFIPRPRVWRPRGASRFRSCLQMINFSSLLVPARSGQSGFCPAELGHLFATSASLRRTCSAGTKRPGRPPNGPHNGPGRVRSYKQPHGLIEVLSAPNGSQRHDHLLRYGAHLERAATPTRLQIGRNC